MDSAVTLVVAVVVGALLTWVAAYLNDHFTQRREERRAERETKARREEWEREDRIRKEQSEQQEYEKRLEQRTKAYKEFMRASTYPNAALQSESLTSLNESFLEVQIHASNNVSHSAEQLHNLVYKALMNSSDPKLLPQLEQARKEFWEDVRIEAEGNLRNS